MAFLGLSENWLAKELGDLHWSELSDVSGVASDQLADDQGRRLHTSFVRMRFESDAPLRSYRENDTLEFQVGLRRVGRTSLFSEIEMAAPGGTLRASLMSIFSVRGQAGEQMLVSSQPEAKVLQAVPRLDEMPAFATDMQALRAATADRVLFSTPYEIEPFGDLNGLNLLYFASYPKIHDTCERRFFHGLRARLGATADWSFAASVVSRDVFYFGNCPLEDALVFSLLACDFESNGRLRLESALHRRSDGKEIARIFTVKQLLAEGEAYARLWRDGLPAAPPEAGAAGVEAILVAELARALKRDVAAVAPDKPLKSLGADSLAAVTFSARVEDLLGVAMDPAWLYGEWTLRGLAAHLAPEAAVQPSIAPPAASPAPDVARDDPIAIIGLGLRFPGAEEPDAFWELLEAGRDMVGGLPPERRELAAGWRARAGDRALHGGFLDDITGFDPLFFSISPREAERMDPQQRIMLETAWRTLENAGYRASALRGSRTGVFIGISNGDYEELLLERRLGHDFYATTGSTFSLSANRISFVMDFRGPSVAIDTACSSSLVAVHQAAAAIRDGSCDMALAGGVNVTASARRYLAFTEAGMLSPDGRCKSFDARANGYVRGEGGGLVLLKPLRQAVADGDHIQGVLLASAVNHGGAANTITTPNPDAQARLIVEAWSRSGADPRSIGYIEAHGSGTSLGDPIEAAGIKSAFQTLYGPAGQPAGPPHCGIGTVKTNIGHLEAAAGIAGLAKVLLAFEHRTLPASLHFQRLNPHIQLQGAPIYIAAQTAPWRAAQGAEGQDLPLRAGVSSFGSGGVSAHLALQAGPVLGPRLATGRPVLAVLSAPGATQLRAQAEALAACLEAPRGGGLALDDVAYTLQMGREPMAHRLAVLAQDGPGLAAALRGYLAGAAQALAWSGEDVGRGADPVSVAAALQTGDLPALGRLWTNGATVDWAVLHAGQAMRRVALPGAVFARERIWFAADDETPVAGDWLQARPDGGFSLTLTGDDRLVAEHTVGGAKVLAAAASIALLRDAAGRVSGRAVTRLGDLAWTAPLRFGGEASPATVRVTQDGEATLDAAGVVFSRALLLPDAAQAPDEIVDLAALLEGAGPAADIDASYASLVRRGIGHGPLYRVMHRLWLGDGEAVALLQAESGAHPGGAAGMAAALLDGAFQAALCLGDEAERGQLPFSAAELHCFGALSARCYAHVRQTRRLAGMRAFSLMLCDDQGRVLLRCRDLVMKGAVAAAANEVLALRPVWRLAAAAVAGPAPRILMAGAEWAAGLLGDPGVEPATPQAAAAMLQDQAIDCLVYAVDPVEDPQAAAQQLQAFTALLQGALAARRGAARLKILHLSRGFVGDGAACGRSQIAATLAVLRSLRAETPLAATRAVELAPDLVDGAAAAMLAAELAEDWPTPLAIRLAAGGRWRLGLQEMDIPGPGGLAACSGKVALIAGGAGGIGLHLTRALLQAGARQVVLCCRSPATPALTQRLAALSPEGRIDYVQADIADRDALAAALGRVRARHGELGAVFHAAGVLRDGFLRDKPAQDIEAVLRPKLQGAANLDALTRDDDLAMFVLFGSVVALTGNLGQADYAFANAWLEGFARRRAVDGGPGRTVLIDWPLWADGGMQASAAGDRMLREMTGAVPLASSQAMAALDCVLAGGELRTAILAGPAADIRAALRGDLEPPVPAAAPAEGLEALIEARLVALVAEATGIAASRIRPGEMLERYGMDSVLALRLTQRLEADFGELEKTLFFEYRTIADLAAYLQRQHHAAAEAAWGAPRASPPASRAVMAAAPTVRLPPAVPVAASGEDIAIVGVAGRYPMASDLKQFWRNLCDGRNCVTEIPVDRWDLNRDFSAERAAGKSYGKWGGFIADVDKFDPLFFNISPREAALMDPQERLFLETAWAALEDAGVTRETLPAERTGVFVGVMYGEYQLYGAEETLRGNPLSTTSFYASIANRVSYHLNLGGPSLALDTMCSSSLTAIHLACQSLRSGESDAAIAGGVNISIHPNKYLLLSRGGFLSSEGLCRSFGAGGDGYVPGEGVGAVLLKRKSQALADGDRILGVIRGSAVNHGGKTNGFSVPNPQAQGRLVARAMEQAGVAPDQIDYVEAHGTGTALGDPIEIAGLTRAFAERGGAGAAAACPVGSAKSSIGHLEAAAGIAGVTKVLQQMRHRQLPPSLHSETLNPNIRFAGTPFVIQRGLAPWVKRNGGDGPLTAAISSFGAGGANAHVVIEAHPEPAAQPDTGRPRVIVLSARSEARLRDAAGRLLEAVAAPDAPPLRDIAYTLQIGREAMPARLAVVADTPAALGERLARYLAGGTEGIHSGTVADDGGALFDGDDGDVFIAAAIATQDWDRLARLWVLGARPDWRGLYEGETPRRESLPTYPFAREPYWLGRKAGAASPAESGAREMLLGKTWREAPQTGPAGAPGRLLVLAPAALEARARVLCGASDVLLLDDGAILADEAAGIAAARRTAQDGAAYDGVIDLCDLAPDGPDAAQAPFGRIAFLRTLLESVRQRPMALLHIAARLVLRAGDRSSLRGAVMAGLVRGLGAEYRHLRARSLDLDATTDLRAVVAAEWAIEAGPTEAAYRAGVRLVPEWTQIPAPAHAWRPDPELAVVVTGGTRGIGAEIARLLAARGVKRLALMGAVALPPRAQWNSLPAGTDGAVLARVRLVRDLEAAGAQVLLHAGPLTDRPALDAFFAEVRRDLGPIGGVVHCAGAVSRGRPAFLHKTAADMGPVFEPKVAGLATLQQALAGDALRFFALFSSVSGAAPMLAAGMTDYAAANGFMDAFAVHRRALGETFWRSIVWPSWKEVGLGEVTTAAYSALGFASLRTMEGLALFEAAMAAGDHAQLMAARIDPALFSAQALPCVAMPSSTAAVPLRLEPAAPRVESRAAAGEADILAGLRGVFARELQIDPALLGADIPFERFGVDSILLVDLVKALEGWLGLQLDPSLFLEHPTLGSLARSLAGQGAVVPPASAQPQPAAAVAPPRPPSGPPEGIAIIGMACRFPGAPDTGRFWANLAGGVSSVREAPLSRWDWRALYSPTPVPGKTTGKWGGFVDGIEDFDPGYFGIAEADAPQVDPLVRLALEVSAAAVSDAGYRREALDGVRAGVFIGARSANYGARIAAPSKNSITGIGQNFITAHLAQVYNLRGPNMVVDTACSSSLVSLHLACRSLASGEADLALAGGVEVLLDETPFLILSEARALSPDGACHVFDAAANGFAPGEGCGVVVLKRLADAIADGDRILAVIEGSAVNNDGRTMGITTPNPAAQQEVVGQALAAAGLEPGALSYIEAHGTGTMIGDPIEVRALSAVFGQSAGECLIGSVKSNIGHLLSAAGVASVIKVVLALQHRSLPPTIHCETPNPRIEFERTPFQPNRTLRDWTPRQGVRRAGISAFGFGGANAHLILREAPAHDAGRPPLPAPVFARRRHWLEAATVSPRPVPAVAAAMPSPPRLTHAPLLPLAPDARDAVFTGRTVLGWDNPIVQNHRVHGVRLLPGVALVDLAYRAAVLAGLDPFALALSRVLFEEPVSVAEGGRRAIEVEIDARRAPFTVVARSRDAEATQPWRDNMRAEFQPDASAPAWRDLAGLKDASAQAAPLDASYARGRACGIVHSGFMKGEGRILPLPLAGGALAEIALDGAAAAHLGDFLAHPAHLDSATLIPFYLQTRDEAAAFIPMYIDRVRLHGALPAEIRVVASDLEGAARDGDVLHSTLALCDSDGRVLCELTRLAVKRIRAAGDITRLTAAAAPAASEAVSSVSAEQIAADLRAMFQPFIGGAGAMEADTGFYELGLDSVALLQVGRQIEARLGQRVYPTLLFEYNTLRSLSEHLFASFAPSWGGEAAAPPTPAASESDRLRLEIGWRDAPAGRPRRVGTTLVVGATAPSFEALRDLAAGRAVLATPAAAPREIASDHVELRLDARVDFAALLQRLAAEGRPVEGVLWLSDGGAGPARRLSGLLALAQAILAALPSRPVRLLYAYRDGPGLEAVADAALEGFVQTLRRETEAVRPRLAAFDGADWVARAWTEYVGDGEEPVVRLGRGGRQARQLSLAPQAWAAVPAAIGKPMVWLITGGLGGLGLLIAEHLAARPGVALVLCGRQAPGPAQQARLDALTAAGAQVLVQRCDVTRLDEVRAAVAAACARFGAVHGVIHAAGVLRDGLIPTKAAADVAVVLAPKIDGVLHLDACTAQQPLEHFVLFSSTASVLGNAGQSDYAYANGFLDAFALWREGERRAGRRRGAASSVNWPLWRDGGMQVDESVLAVMAQDGLAPLDSAAGLAAFDDLLADRPARALYLQGEQERLMRSLDIAPAPSRPPAILPVRPQAQEEDGFAIVGVAGRYPQSPDLDALWDNLRAGRDCVTEIPADRWDVARHFDASGDAPGKSYSKWGGFLEGIDHFEPLLFGVSPAEAEMMDPQERLFLETVWEVLEDAGYAGPALRRQEVGVFVGAMWSQYAWLGIEEAARGNPISPMAFAASIANRVSYFFDFRGPSLAIDTMCSSSLTAIHMAVESLRRGECSHAIAGGVNLILHPAKYAFLSQMRMVSTDGRCRAFGDGGDGYVPGEGVGAILIKPLSAARAAGDHIHGVIRGSALNHGGRASGYMVPSVEGQGQVIAAAVRRAGVDPESVSFVEAHGTGTSLGDPIEIRGLALGLGAGGAGGRSIGSVKSNMGHLEAAAGIASVTKVLLQMRHRTLAPSLHADTLNAHIDFGAAPASVQRRLEPWTGRVPLRAGISSFGAGGANAHLILEDHAAPARPATPARTELIVLSARTPESLRGAAKRLADWLDRAAPARPSTDDIEMLRRLAAPLAGLAAEDLDLDAPLADCGFGLADWSALSEAVGARFGQAVGEGVLASCASLAGIADRLCAGRPMDLGPVAYTLQVGRAALPERLALIAGSAQQAATLLRGFAEGRSAAGLHAGRAEGAGEMEPASGATADWDRIAQAWVRGAGVPWSDLHPPESRRRLPLPTYAFRRKRYWLPTTAPAVVAEMAPPAIATAPAPDLSVGLFAPSWQPQASPAEARDEAYVLAGRDPAAVRALMDALAAAGRTVAGVTDGAALGRRPDGLHTARFAHAGDWSALLAQLAPAGAPAPRLVIVEAEPETQARAAQAADAAALLLPLAQALMLGPPTAGTYLCLAADGQPGARDLAVLAFLKSMRWESPEHRFGLLAVAGPRFDADRFARALLGETGDTVAVLHRDGQRLAPRFTRAPAGTARAWRRGGVYLVTGGMGALGSRLAGELVRRHGAKVVLAGRSAADAAMIARVEALVPGAPGQVEYRAADITDAGAARALVDAVVAAHGRLDGVLHLARSAEDGPILSKTADAVSRVLRAKLDGAVALDAATAHLPLDVFVMFSSLAGFTGLRGSADYAFACAFQNGFALWRDAEAAAGRRSGASRALCWSQWEHDVYSNAARDARFGQAGFRLFDMAAGMQALDQALGAGAPLLALLRGDPERLDGLIDEDAIHAIFAPASARAMRPQARAAPAPDDLAQKVAGLSDAELTALLDRVDWGKVVALDAAPRPGAPADGVETVVRRIMTEVLKLDAEVIDLDAPFQDYGIDSVGAVQIAIRLEKALDRDVPARLLAADRTGTQLLRALDGRDSYIQVAE